MTEEKQEDSGLTKDSSITEIFDAIKLPKEGVNVRPVTIQEDELDTRLAIFIRGSHQMSSFIMAQIMIEIQSMFDMQEQAAAAAAPRIIKPRG